MSFFTEAVPLSPEPLSPGDKEYGFTPTTTRYTPSSEREQEEYWPSRCGEADRGLGPRRG